MELYEELTLKFGIWQYCQQRNISFTIEMYTRVGHNELAYMWHLEFVNELNYVNEIHNVTREKYLQYNVIKWSFE